MMDAKTKSKPGRTKSMVNNTENKGPESNSIKRVLQNDKDQSIENGLRNIQNTVQGIIKKLPNYENLLRRIAPVIEDKETGLSASLSLRGI